MDLLKVCVPAANCGKSPTCFWSHVVSGTHEAAKGYAESHKTLALALALLFRSSACRGYTPLTACFLLTLAPI